MIQLVLLSEFRSVVIASVLEIVCLEDLAGLQDSFLICRMTVSSKDKLNEKYFLWKFGISGDQRCFNDVLRETLNTAVLSSSPVRAVENAITNTDFTTMANMPLEVGQVKLIFLIKLRCKFGQSSIAGANGK